MLIEAASCGRAVITTDHPGCRDAIEPNVSGILVPIRNAEALADAILDLAKNPIKRKSMGVAGRRLAEDVFDVYMVADKHLIIYGELVSKNLR